jgi:DNA-binding NtrC family response regulator
MDDVRLLLVDDDRHLLESMAGWLCDQGYPTDTAESQSEALLLIKRKGYDIVLCDIRLPDGDGFHVLAHCREHAPNMTVILLTGCGTVDMAVEAIRAGAFDFLTKPLIDEELEMAIQRAISHRQVIEENRNLKAQLNERFGIDNIVGRDHRMLKVFDLIESVADTRTTVLITGESGTGKSMIARAIHRYSSRRDRPFVEVACGALSESLLESELFGHVAGAFTGASANRVGKFLQADGGTIFLDEISTASPSMQVKLLRVLQDFEFEPVGGTETHRIDTRVILATNDNLDQLVAEGKFRQDLYYRINVIDILLPSLRDRISDIPMLATVFLENVCNDSGKQVDGFTGEAMAAMQGHTWPGNVRELQNVVERAVLLGKGQTVGLEDLPPEILHATPYVSSLHSNGSCTLKEALEAPERRIILDMLESNNWNRHATAEALGINRTTLYKKMKRLGLEDRAMRV